MGQIRNGILKDYFKLKIENRRLRKQVSELLGSKHGLVHITDSSGYLRIRPNMTEVVAQMRPITRIDFVGSELHLWGDCHCLKVRLTQSVQQPLSIRVEDKANDS